MLKEWMRRKSGLSRVAESRAKKAIRLGFAALAGLSVFGMAKPISACSCAWVESWASYARETEFIFIGKALSRTDTEPTLDSAGRLTLTSDDPTFFEFEVTEAIKGIQSQALQLWTERDGASCGENFELDSLYLVFAYMREGDTLLRTSLCSFNRKLGSQVTDSIVNEVKAAVAPSSLRQTRTPKAAAEGAKGYSGAGKMPQRQNGALQSLERRDQRIDGRHTDGRRTDGRHVWP